MERSIILGDEFDVDLQHRLIRALKQLEVEIANTSQALGGSQDVSRLKVKIGGDLLIIEAETYIGLSLTGNPALLSKIQSILQEFQYDKRHADWQARRTDGSQTQQLPPNKFAIAAHVIE